VGISYLRRMFIHGARAVIKALETRVKPFYEWVNEKFAIKMHKKQSELFLQLANKFSKSLFGAVTARRS